MCQADRLRARRFVDVRASNSILAAELTARGQLHATFRPTDPFLTFLEAAAAGLNAVGRLDGPHDAVERLLAVTWSPLRRRAPGSSNSRTSGFQTRTR